MATYILYTGLTECGACVDYEIPERIRDGYGINMGIIEQAYKEKIDTIITCDNGIAALEQIKHAKELGMTVIVTDHHDIAFVEEQEERTYMLPEADAVVNPKQPECTYPYEGICGGFVAFKVIQELYKRYQKEEEKIQQLLEFATIATVCDVMDLAEENRSLVKFGLERLNATKNIGLKALIRATGIEGKEIGVYHLGFIIGPCINASGRLESAKMSLELFLEKEENKANELAIQLKELNDERKDMTAKGVERAIALIEEKRMQEDKVLVIYLPDCHESLAGIIAGRIKELYYRPTIVLTKAHEGVKGSARSIERYNMFEELNRCKDLLTKFGGHPMAAGLSLKESDIEVLRHRLNVQTTLTEEDFIKKVSFDMVLPFEKISYHLINEIALLEPYGKGNTKPLFAVKDISIIKAMILGKNKNVIKLIVAEKNKKNVRYTAMIFQGVDAFETLIKEKYNAEALEALYRGNCDNVFLDMVFYPEINEYNGIKTIQIMVQHYR